jgi:hypothetical protein
MYGTESVGGLVARVSLDVNSREHVSAFCAESVARVDLDVDLCECGSMYGTECVGRLVVRVSLDVNSRERISTFCAESVARVGLGADWCKRVSMREKESVVVLHSANVERFGCRRECAN